MRERGKYNYWSRMKILDPLSCFYIGNKLFFPFFFFLREIKLIILIDFFFFRLFSISVCFIACRCCFNRDSICSFILSISLQLYTHSLTHTHKMNIFYLFELNLILYNLTRFMRASKNFQKFVQAKYKCQLYLNSNS